MLGFTATAYWPCCEACSGKIWKFHRKPECAELETQSFTCSKCGHVTVLMVSVRPDALTRGRDGDTIVPLVARGPASWRRAPLPA